MNKIETLSFSLLFAILHSCSLIGLAQSNSKPISHQLWDELLQKNVSDDGHVNYKGFLADKEKFDQYLSLLSSHHPIEKNWTYEERKAYWINAYNAFTVKLIVDHYPVKSIKEIGGKIYKVNTAWDIRSIIIEGKDYDLNNIEHDILRKKYTDPRIHFSINCASVSCPKLRNKAFTAENLDAQLDEVARSFVNDTSKNKITPNELNVSRIFKWFKGDFTTEGTLIDFLNKYSNTTIDAKAKIEFQDYNWNLNE